ncbi:recombinase family protein [Streptomyces rimosus]
MANLVHKRVSTEQQSTACQDLVLGEAESRTRPSSRRTAAPPAASPQRPKCGELLAYARPGGTVHIPGMFRLVRSTGHILDVFDILHRDRLALRIHDGAFSAMDLTVRPPAHRRTAVHREVHGAAPRRRRRTPARPDVRRTPSRRGQGQQGRSPPRRGG